MPPDANVIRVTQALDLKCSPNDEKIILFRPLIASHVICATRPCSVFAYRTRAVPLSALIVGSSLTVRADGSKPAHKHYKDDRRASVSRHRGPMGTTHVCHAQRRSAWLPRKRRTSCSSWGTTSERGMSAPTHTE